MGLPSVSAYVHHLRSSVATAAYHGVTFIRKNSPISDQQQETFIHLLCCAALAVYTRVGAFTPHVENRGGTPHPRSCRPLRSRRKHATNRCRETESAAERATTTTTTREHTIHVRQEQDKAVYLTAKCSCPVPTFLSLLCCAVHRACCVHKIRQVDYQTRGNDALVCGSCS